MSDGRHSHGGVAAFMVLVAVWIVVLVLVVTSIQKQTNRRLCNLERHEHVTQGRCE